MFGLMKKMFIALSSNVINRFIYLKYVSLSNQRCEIQPTFMDLCPREFNQEFRYYPFAVKLDIYVGSCNSLNDLSDKV